MKKNYFKLFILITSLTVIFDQILKLLIVKLNPGINLKFLTIHLITNTGAGFGILQGKTGFLAILSLLVTIFIMSYYKNLPQEKYLQISFALLLGGTIGNLIDRLFRKEVIDFLDLKFWPAFNLADAAISISVIYLIWYFWNQ